jgi:hypothetical protein
MGRDVVKASPIGGAFLCTNKQTITLPSGLNPFALLF